MTFLLVFDYRLTCSFECCGLQKTWIKLGQGNILLVQSRTLKVNKVNKCKQNHSISLLNLPFFLQHCLSQQQDDTLLDCSLHSFGDFVGTSEFNETFYISHSQNLATA